MNEHPGLIDATATAAATLRRYQRPVESVLANVGFGGSLIPVADADEAIAASSLSEGGKSLLRGLLRTGTTRVFPGGGLGIEYGSLLKTAARPDYVGAHVREAAAHLLERRVDLLLVPGMSGYPIGAMYAAVAGLPAVLLKKVRLAESPATTYPAGAFVIPSYTEEGDVVMHADPAAVQDIVDTVVAPQLAAQAGDPRPTLAIRVAGADDLIDKATMSHAVGESAAAIAGAAMADFIRRHCQTTGDRRVIETRVEAVAWVTPLIKGYNRPQAHLWEAFRLVPFAGLNVTSVYLDPPAIGIQGVGVLPFAGTASAP